MQTQLSLFAVAEVLFTGHTLHSSCPSKFWYSGNPVVASTPSQYAHELFPRSAFTFPAGHGLHCLPTRWYPALHSQTLSEFSQQPALQVVLPPKSGLHAQHTFSGTAQYFSDPQRHFCAPPSPAMQVKVFAHHTGPPSQGAQLWPCSLFTMHAPLCSNRVEESHVQVRPGLLGFSSV